MKEIVKKIIRQGSSNVLTFNSVMQALSGIELGDYVSITCYKGKIVAKKLNGYKPKEKNK